MSSRKCSLQDTATARKRCQTTASPLYPMQLQNHQPSLRCAHRPTHTCPQPAVLPRQKVWWTQPHLPVLFFSYPHCFSFTSVVQVSPYSATLKFFLTMSCCTEMVYSPRGASEARRKDRSTMPFLDCTFSHSAIRLYSGSYLGKDMQSHQVTLGAWVPGRSSRAQAQEGTTRAYPCPSREIARPPGEIPSPPSKGTFTVLLNCKGCQEQ